MARELTIHLDRPLTDVTILDPREPLPAAAVNASIDVAKSNSWFEEEQARLQKILTEMEQIGASLDQWQEQRLHEMQRATVELAVTIASRLVHKTIDRNEFGVEEMVRQVTNQFDGKTPITVWLHPDDLTLLRERLGDEKATEDFLHVVWKTDTQLNRGDCRAETEQYGVVSQWNDHLAEIQEQLTHELTNEVGRG